MASPCHHLFPLITILLLTTTLAAPDVHDILPKYNIPKGLLPNNVKSYTLSNNGVFDVQLKSPCYVQFEDQLVYYNKAIKGKLSYGLVSDVSGIQAKKLFFWVPVTGMKVVEESNVVEFYVGALSQRLPADLFQDIPTCMHKMGCSEMTTHHPESQSF